jgi:hypothetical protein
MTTATSAAARAASTQSRRLQRAREIITAHDLWGKLTYMDDCPVGGRDGVGDPTVMTRYLIVTATDGGEDGWIDLKDNIREVEDLLRGLLTDEWGLLGTWDLDLVSCKPLLVRLDLHVTYPRSDASHG